MRGLKMIGRNAFEMLDMCSKTPDIKVSFSGRTGIGIDWHAMHIDCDPECLGEIFSIISRLQELGVSFK